MAGLSNFFRRGNVPPGDGPVTYRPVVKDEIEPALRLVLSSVGAPASDEQVLDFLSYSLDRGLDVNNLWVAVRGEQVLWALLPVPSPGKTMLIMTPPRVPARTPPAVVAALAGEVCEHWSRRGIQLAQMLIDPADQPVVHLYRDAGFTELAELLYLQRQVRSGVVAPAIVEGFSIECYSPANYDDFKSVVTRSYEGSHDCPVLNHKRDIEDVIAGHRASGEHDPALWFLVRRKSIASAVLLLTRGTQANLIELVYLGVAPEVRGTGIADWLVKLAIACTSQDGKSHFSLAVDARNVPALKLYYRNGLSRVGSRVAMIRELSPGTKEKLHPPFSSTGHAQVR